MYRVEYVELAGCVVEDRDLVTALDRLDAVRERTSPSGSHHLRGHE
jgi:capsule polysaccharide export protein KpsC/LpsZ